MFIFIKTTDPCEGWKEVFCFSGTVYSTTLSLVHPRKSETIILFFIMKQLLNSKLLTLSDFNI